MANFKYKARDKFSRAISGVIEAQDKSAAAKKLQDLDYVPITIEEFNESGASEVFSGFKRVKLTELSAFTRQLYVLQKAGLPLLSSLVSIAEQIKNKYFKTVIEDIAANIKGGSSFSEALKKHSRVFNDIYISMIRAGEMAGSFAAILERLTLLIEQEIDTNNRIKSATRYPMIAFFVLCLGFTIIVTFVIPRFAAVYGRFNALLPLPTRILIFVNLLISRYWHLFILGLIAVVFAALRFINSKAGRPIWDNLKIRVPIFGPLVKILIMSRFSRITAILMKSGIPILDVLDLSAKTCGNLIIARAINNIKESVNQGKGMSEPMKISGLFPDVVIQMVSAGEQTGKVDELLLSVADYYDIESGYMIKNLTTYIEPVLILILGVMVMVMALAIFLPMWNLIKVFKSG